MRIKLATQIFCLDSRFIQVSRIGFPHFEHPKLHVIRLHLIPGILQTARGFQHVFIANDPGTPTPRNKDVAR